MTAHQAAQLLAEEHVHDLEVEAPCCSGRDSEGNPSCGCHGQYSVSCIAPDECPGITDNEAQDAIESAMEGPDYDDYDPDR